ncbi:hypothetical protein [Pandoravirus japonicus]|uniref:Uncharacterized protein n=1 Tax=Pandoravirus japonicus TaxID=2823154 RepID=A0A811BLY2_9VIRU|nr:hypothetical protein [Pandoravirus japonicus]
MSPALASAEKKRKGIWRGVKKRAGQGHLRTALRRMLPNNRPALCRSTSRWARFGRKQIRSSCRIQTRMSVPLPRAPTKKKRR